MMHIKKITYYEPNISQASGERERLEESGYVVMEGKNQISDIINSIEEAEAWIDNELMLFTEFGD